MTREEVMIHLGVDSKSVQRGLRGVTTQVADFGRSVAGKFAAAFSFGFAMAGLKKVLANVQDLDLRARALEISPSFLQDIENIGLASNMSREQVGKMLDTFAKNAKAGTDIETAFYQLADRLKNVPDPAERARLAVENFGREGVKMAGLISGGADAVKNLAGQFTKLSESDITGILETEAAMSRLENTLSKMQGWFVGKIAFAGRALGEAWYGGADIATAIGRANRAIVEQAQRDAKRRQESAEAARVAAQKKQYDSDLAAWQKFNERKAELGLDTLSPGMQVTQLQVLKHIEQQKAAKAKSYREQLQHAEKIAELDARIHRVKMGQEKELADARARAFKNDVERRQKISELQAKMATGGRKEFLPSLEQLAQSWGPYARDAARLQYLEADAPWAAAKGNRQRFDADVREIQTLRAKLAKQGVYENPMQPLIDELSALTVPIKQNGALPVAVRVKE